MKLIKLNLIWSDLIQISFESELIWTDLNLIQTELIWIWTELNWIWIWIWIWIWSEPNRTDLNWIIYINIFRITLPIFMLETWSYHHSNPLNEANLMVLRSLKSNHWMLRSTKLKIICLLIIVKNFDFIMTFICIIWDPIGSDQIQFQLD